MSNSKKQPDPERYQQFYNQFHKLQEDVALMSTLLTLFLDSENFHSMGSIQDGFIVARDQLEKDSEALEQIICDIESSRTTNSCC